MYLYGIIKCFEEECLPWITHTPLISHVVGRAVRHERHCCLTFTMSRASIELLLERKVTIRFPNLFSGFLIDNPVVNPGYEAVRSESETWLQKYSAYVPLIVYLSNSPNSIMSLSPQQYKRVHYCDFTYFCAVLVPHASHERLRVISDWGSWVSLNNHQRRSSSYLR